MQIARMVWMAAAVLSVPATALADPGGGAHEHGGIMGWGWGGGLLFGLIAIVAVVLVIAAFLRHRGRPEAPGSSPADARAILEARFARGEIDEDEFKRRRATLDGG